MMRATGFLLGLAALIDGAVQLWIVGQAGFPDGHLTQVDRAMAPLENTLGWLGVAVGTGLIGTAFLRPTWLRAALLAAIALGYVLPHVGLDAYETHLHSFLNHGQGG